MPVWNLDYHLESTCTTSDVEQDRLVFRSDPAFVRYDSRTDEFDPNRIHVQVAMHDQIGLQPQSSVILRLRGATAQPSLNFGSGLTVRMTSQPGPPPPIGALVGMDSQGRIGFLGQPIGVMLGHDSVTQSSTVFIQGAQPPPLVVSRIVPDENGSFRVDQWEDRGIPLEDLQRQPLPILNQEEIRRRWQMAAYEDHRVFQALDALAIEEQKPEAVAKVVKKPEPRPPVKNRYERILDILAKDPEKGGA